MLAVRRPGETASAATEPRRRTPPVSTSIVHRRIGSYEERLLLQGNTKTSLSSRGDAGKRCLARPTEVGDVGLHAILNATGSRLGACAFLLEIRSARLFHDRCLKQRCLTWF